MRRLLCRSLTLCLAAAMPCVASAASIYLDVAGIVGKNPTPGNPDAMALQSLSIVPSAFSVIKAVDSASPQIQTALGLGTVFSAGQLLFYDAAPSDPPDAVLSYHNLLASASQPLNGPGIPQEQDTFNTSTPSLLYLELPGVTGKSSTPGHPDVMLVDSLSTDGTSFSVVKLVDTASPQISTALALGTHFPIARLLLYDSMTPSGPPDAILEFHTVLVSSSETLPSGELPHEQDTFSFVTITQPVPEPASDLALLLAIGTIALVARARRPVSR